MQINAVFCSGFYHNYPLSVLISALINNPPLPFRHRRFENEQEMNLNIFIFEPIDKEISQNIPASFFQKNDVKLREGLVRIKTRNRIS